uniref:Uncharacterized protein n=1 Tax=Rangifer tarandus platyrhynchus TaxID=3082113 RepID=A0ACB0E608_RANTA|nr:unnamed protein product [Rangifer tarandus platyrhynchus]
MAGDGMVAVSARGQGHRGSLPRDQHGRLWPHLLRDDRGLPPSPLPSTAACGRIRCKMTLMTVPCLACGEAVTRSVGFGGLLSKKQALPCAPSPCRREAFSRRFPGGLLQGAPSVPAFLGSAGDETGVLGCSLPCPEELRAACLKYPFPERLGCLAGAQGAQHGAPLEWRAER